MAAGKWQYRTNQSNVSVLFVLEKMQFLSLHIYVKLTKESDMIIGIHVRQHAIDVIQNGRDLLQEFLKVKHVMRHHSPRHMECNPVRHIYRVDIREVWPSSWMTHGAHSEAVSCDYTIMGSELVDTCRHLWGDRLAT